MEVAPTVILAHFHKLQSMRHINLVGIIGEGEMHVLVSLIVFTFIVWEVFMAEKLLLLNVSSQVHAEFSFKYSNDGYRREP